MNSDERVAQRVYQLVRLGASQDEVKAFLDPNYIPRGKRVSVEECTNFRRNPYPAARCTARTGYDIQSGPFYCGKPALYICDSPDSEPVPCCELHVPTRFVADRNKIVQLEWSAYYACCSY